MHSSSDCCWSSDWKYETIAKEVCRNPTPLKGRHATLTLSPDVPSLVFAITPKASHLEQNDVAFDEQQVPDASQQLEGQASKPHSHANRTELEAAANVNEEHPSNGLCVRQSYLVNRVYIHSTKKKSVSIPKADQC